MSATSFAAESAFAFSPSRAGRLVGARRLPVHKGMQSVMGPRVPETAELAELVQAVARDRDRKAFAELFSYFAPRLKTYLVRLGASSASAEEHVQEAMLTLWRRADTFDPRQANVRTWMFTIARNKRIDALRREKRPELDPNDPALVPDATPSADDAFEAMEHEDILREAIDQLPKEQADLLRICYYEDKSHRQIARELDLPLGTVKSRLRLALARLRATLKDRVS